MDNNPTQAEQEEFWRLQRAWLEAKTQYDRIRAPTTFEQATRAAHDAAQEYQQRTGDPVVVLGDFMPAIVDTGEEIDDDPSPELAEARTEVLAKEMEAELAYQTFLFEHMDKAFRVFDPKDLENAITDEIEPLWGEGI